MLADLLNRHDRSARFQLDSVTRSELHACRLRLDRICTGRELSMVMSHIMVLQQGAGSSGSFIVA